MSAAVEKHPTHSVTKWGLEQLKSSKYQETDLPARINDKGTDALLYLTLEVTQTTLGPVFVQVLNTPTKKVW